MARTKFRPYFTEPQLAEIIRCVKSVSTDIALIRYLDSFHLKLERGLIDPQYTAKPSLEEKLGFGDPAKSETPLDILLSRFSTAPEKLSPLELQRVQDYRWQSGLMTDAESDAYEAKLMSTREGN